MTATNPTQTTLFGDDFTPKYGESETEAAVRELIEEIRDKDTMTPARRVLCSTALRLARLIDNPGKSAIAAVNAAAQLTPLIEKIVGEDATDPNDLPEELRNLLAAFEVKPHVND